MTGIFQLPCQETSHLSCCESHPASATKLPADLIISLVSRDNLLVLFAAQRANLDLENI